MSHNSIPFEISNNKKIQKGEWYKIAETLNGLKPTILSNKNGDTIKTQEIKVALTKLGHELKKFVYANKLTEIQIDDINNHLKQIDRFYSNRNGFKNTEWLFDVHWYTDIKGEFYIPYTLDLVAESEWQKVRETNKKRGERKKEEMELSAIKFDFQKLLTSNANLKLMICRLSNLSELDKLDIYVNKAIENNKHLQKRSQFLVISYLKKQNKMYYLKVQKR